MKQKGGKKQNKNGGNIIEELANQMPKEEISPAAAKGADLTGAVQATNGAISKFEPKPDKKRLDVQASTATGKNEEKKIDCGCNAFSMGAPDSCLNEEQMKIILEATQKLDGNSPYQAYLKLRETMQCNSGNAGQKDRCMWKKLKSQYGNMVHEEYWASFPLKDQIKELTDWLGNETIELLEKQLEIQFDFYKYIGFTTYQEFNDMVDTFNPVRLARLFKQNPKKTVFGVVLNECVNRSSGQHWVSMSFCRVKKDWTLAGQKHVAKSAGPDMPGLTTHGHSYEQIVKINDDLNDSPYFVAFFFDSQAADGPAKVVHSDPRPGVVFDEWERNFVPRVDDWYKALNQALEKEGLTLLNKSKMIYNTSIYQLDDYACGYWSVYSHFIFSRYGPCSLDILQQRIATKSKKYVSEAISNIFKLGSVQTKGGDEDSY